MKSLYNAIQSVLGQTYPNIELIIVDNHSTDGTKLIIDNFCDDRINYFKIKNKGIIARSRNLGIQNAKEIG